MKFYIDTNILIDALLRRQPFHEKASALLNFALNNKISIYTSSHCIATLHYVCKKNINETDLRSIISKFLEFIIIIPVDDNILKKSAKSQHKDFEDAIQILCAHQIKNLDGIITRNLKDFSSSEIPVFPPDEAINYIKNN